MATTFDPNRVGPGTFKLVRDASTGTYSIQEVGFTKLPSLTLPDLTPTTTTPTPTPTPTPDPDTPDVSQPKLPQVGGGGGDRQDFTSFTLKTPDDQIDQATQISQNLRTFSPDTAEEQFKRQATLPSNVNIVDEVALTGREVDENKIDRGNPTGDPRIVSEEQGLVGGRVPDAIRTGQPAIGMGVPDAVKFGQPSLPDTKITNIIGKTQDAITKTQDAITKAQDVISNKKPVQLLGIGLRMGTEALVNLTTSPQQQALNRSNKNALSAVGYKTIGELGGSTDPGRIAGNPADNVFAGMNAQSARGNVMTGSANRIKTRETVGIQRVEARYGKNSKQAKDFRAKTETFKDQRQQVLDKQEEQQAKINKETMNQGPPSQSGGGGGSSGGGKSIVCTAMYQTTGLQDWAKAMKIWYIYQKRYLTIQHQEGYHKLFKPFVKAMHKSNIVKAIGAHFAKHRTQHLKHILFKSKPSLLGKVYSKVLETICYWAGKK